EYLKNFDKSARVVHLRTSHGAAGARNVALGLAKCAWVAFQDADDIWAQDKLEKQVNALIAHPEWVACHTGIQVFNKMGVVNEFSSKPSPLKVTDLMMGSHVTPPSLIIKKQVIDLLGGFDTSFISSEDYEFSL